MNGRNRQQGVALITAIVIVTLAVTTAVFLTFRQQLDIRRTGNVLNSDRAYQHLLGAEAWALTLLAEDRKEGDIDSLDEDWATVLPPIEIEGGLISGLIIDLQARINVNSVIAEGDKKLDGVVLERLERLFDQQELARTTSQALVDWLDPDVEPQGPEGAEDSYYLGLEVPYRSANSPMVSISELRLVKGIDAQAYERLAPLLTALPTRTAININTAPAQVLKAIGLDDSAVEATLEQREEEAFESVDEFLQQPALKDLKIDQSGLSVSSQYFLVQAEARVGTARTRLNSLLFREQTGIMHVIHRSQIAP